MYVPTQNEETRIPVMHALLRTHPLGTWVTQADEGLIANHIPFLIDAERGEFGTLVGHVARANPVWKTFSKTADSLVIFQGPQTYITPSWYPGKQEHGKVVPTWNYAVVHAHGLPRSIDDRDWLLAHVSAMVDTQESREVLPWQVADAPPDYIDSMLRAIVGIEIPIAKLAGKWKVSQNRADADRAATVTGLLERMDEQSREMAALVGRPGDKTA